MDRRGRLAHAHTFSDRFTGRFARASRRVIAHIGVRTATTTLRACSAHEAYLRTYQRALEPRLVLEFLLLDRLFPRSVFAALSTAEGCLTDLEPDPGRAGFHQQRVGPKSAKNPRPSL